MSATMSVPLPAPQFRESVETAIPARENVKFYQVGSYAVGNRLAELDYRSVQSDPNRINSLTSGHRACQGCGEALGARYALDTAMDAADRDLVAVNATGCLEVFSTPDLAPLPPNRRRVLQTHRSVGGSRSRPAPFSLP